MRLESSPNTRFKSLATRWYDIVKKSKEINKHDLMLKLGLTPGQYYLNQATIKHLLKEEIEYDRPSQTWRFVG